jgi:hypothetical protein
MEEKAHDFRTYSMNRMELSFFMYTSILQKVHSGVLDLLNLVISLIIIECDDRMQSPSVRQTWSLYVEMV